jgi:iron complex transport system substrate-binding protein
MQVSMEDVVARDPDAIVVAIPEGQGAALTQRPAWSTLRAVQAGRVYFVNPDIVTRPGPAVIEGIKEVSARLMGDK